jgi:hypothetical protein
MIGWVCEVVNFIHDHTLILFNSCWLLPRMLIKAKMIELNRSINNQHLRRESCSRVVCLWYPPGVVSNTFYRIGIIKICNSCPVSSSVHTYHHPSSHVLGCSVSLSLTYHIVLSLLALCCI